MKLIFAADIIRHGDRATIHKMPKVSTAWKEEELGNLTSKGRMDAIQVGKDFKKYYVDANSLLPYSFQPEAIQIRSTDFQRTIETARGVMRGMYPSQSETIPITIVPKQEDLLLLGLACVACKDMQSLTRARYNYSPNLSKATIREILSELEKINDKFGTSLNDIDDIVKLADIINTSRIHNKPLLKKISDKEVEQIFRLRDLVFIDMFGSPNAACLGASDLMKQILTTMADKIRNKMPLKYMLFSAHDINILCILSLLDLPLDTSPYLSNIRFELFEQGSAKFFVRILYRNSPLKVVSEEFCPFEQWKALIGAKLKKKCGLG